MKNNIEEFLDEETPVKVLFLFTAHSSCEACGEMLRMFADLGEKMYDPEIVEFGYYDVYKNDNLLIRDEISPSFLIFVN